MPEISDLRLADPDIEADDTDLDVVDGVPVPEDQEL